jgi:hypothetical protein
MRVLVAARAPKGVVRVCVTLVSSAGRGPPWSGPPGRLRPRPRLRRRPRALAGYCRASSGAHDANANPDSESFTRGNCGPAPARWTRPPTARQRCGPVRNPGTSPRQATLPSRARPGAPNDAVEHCAVAPGRDCGQSRLLAAGVPRPPNDHRRNRCCVQSCSSSRRCY